LCLGGTFEDGAQAFNRAEPFVEGEPGQRKNWCELLQRAQGIAADLTRDDETWSQAGNVLQTRRKGGADLREFSVVIRKAAIVADGNEFVSRVERKDGVGHSWRKRKNASLVRVTYWYLRWNCRVES
jgi:hypothetical protein